jgi:hypothetical protein
MFIFVSERMYYLAPVSADSILGELIYRPIDRDNN